MVKEETTEDLKPLLTAVMPVYNGERHLRDTAGALMRPLSPMGEYTFRICASGLRHWISMSLVIWKRAYGKQMDHPHGKTTQNG